MQPLSFATVVFLALAPLAGAQSGPFVRVQGQATSQRFVSQLSVAQSPASGGSWSAVSVCAKSALAWHNQAVPGGGGLSPLSFANPAIVSSSGRIAFFANVAGVPRNQGIFTADAQGLHPIAIGCGG